MGGGDLPEGVDFFCGEDARVSQFTEKTKVCFAVDRGDLEVDGAETKAVAAYEESDATKQFGSSYPSGGWATDGNDGCGR